MEREYEYEVALSFAGEQRNYVKRVSDELERLGIKHFYDNKEKVKLWGKNLTQYLDRIYYQDSKFFIPFISKEYASQNWTRWEMCSALERNMMENRTDFQQYILPVKLDDTRIPGIWGSVAFLDARQYGPEQLAARIYEKIRGVPVRNYTDTQLTPDTDTFLQNFNASQLKTLKTLYDKSASSQVVVLYGERGLGKRTLIYQFLSSHSNTIKVIPCIENQYQYQPLLHALDVDLLAAEYSNGLDFQEQLKHSMIQKCQKERLIFYFENINQCEEDYITFLLEFAETIIRRYPVFNVFLLFEFDSDENVDLINRFYRFPPSSINLIHIQRLDDDSLKKYFFKTMGKIEIMDEDLSYIIESSFGNVMYLNVIINYLRGKGIIIQRGRKLRCKQITQGLLTDVLKDYILQRYNRLDENLKAVLSKSAIIGDTFGSDLLSKPFGIINANDLLKKIEDISLLIKSEDSDLYAFENTDAYKLISDNISNAERQEWHNLLAEYFERRLKKEKNRRSSFTADKEISHLYSIARHYKYAGKLEPCLKYYQQLITKYHEIRDYRQELKAIQEIILILDDINLDQYQIDISEYQLLKSEAVCYQILGNYENAIQLYTECLDTLPWNESETEALEIQLELAYSLFMNGGIQRPLELTLKLKEQLEQREVKDIFYIRTLSFLSSIYDVTGNEQEKKSYYIQSLNLCREKGYEEEYYIMLRKASLVYDEALAAPMYAEAEKYFREKHNIRFLAEVLHNRATNEIYLNHSNNIEKAVLESISLFDSYGGQAVHYPLNTKGIYEMLFEKDYNKAIETFLSALNYDIEPFSQITLRTNLLNCYNKLRLFDKGMTELHELKRLMALPEAEGVLVYQIYHDLNWAFYYYHQENYDDCLKILTHCGKLNYMEPRYEYVYKNLKYMSKKKSGQKARKPSMAPCLPVFRECLEQELYFTTVRFYE